MNDTNPRLNINNFDLIRLLAALQVAVKHLMVHLDIGVRYTEILSVFPGVPIFFFISGFLIFRSFNRITIKGRFFLNRILRIYPALIICFILCVCFLLISGYLSWRSLASLPFLFWTICQLTILQIYNPDFMRGFGVGVLNGSLWTISVELQFYLLTPLIAIIARRNKILWIFVMVIGIFANQIMQYLSPSFFSKFYSVSSVPWLYMFMAGAFLSEMEGLQKKILELNLVVMLAVYLISTWIIYSFHLGMLGNDINPVSFFILILLIFKLAYSKPELSNMVLKKNDISYGVYIYHMPILNFFIFFNASKTVSTFFMIFTVTIFIAFCSWFFVEKNALNFKKNTK